MSTCRTVKKQIKTIVETTRSFRYKRLGGTDYCAFEEKWESSGNLWHGGCDDVKPQSSVKRGFASIKNVRKVKGHADINTDVPAPSMYGGIARIVLFSKTDIENIKKGLLPLEDAIDKFANVGPTDTLGIPEGYIPVLWNWGSYRLADVYSQKFISTPISMDYVDADVDNERYDLHKLLEKLKEDPYVLNKETLRISPIPYYNCYEGRNETIQFQYLLPDDDFDRLVRNEDSLSLKRIIMREYVHADECRASDSEKEDE